MQRNGSPFKGKAYWGKSVVRRGARALRCEVHTSTLDSSGREGLQGMQGLGTRGAQPPLFRV